MGGVVSSIGNAIGSTVGGLTGGIANGVGAINNYESSLTPEQRQQLAQAIVDQQKGFTQNMANQNSLAQALLAQSQGQGVNLAQGQLDQATNRNIAQGTGMIASQKGINPALAARLALQNTNMMNQQAAGQGAQIRAEQQLGAQGQLGGLYRGMGELANQNIHANSLALTGADKMNAEVAQENAKTKGQIAGGLFNAIGGGGMLSSLGKGFGGGGAAGASEVAGGPMDAIGSSGAADAVALAAHGGKIPGKANVPGDSTANDTVPTMLSPGEIVVPRSQADDPEKAKAFIDHIMKEKGSGKKKVESYSDVVKSHRELKAKVEELEKKIKAKKKGA